jgi:hypothetical protein
MAKERPQSRPDAASEAMQQALEAEERAREAVAGCREQAERLREQARVETGRIQERTDGRLEWIHRHCEAVLAERLRALTAEEPQAPGEDRPWADETTLAAAAEALAADLTLPETGSGEDDRA